MGEKVFQSEQSNYIPWIIDGSYVLDREVSRLCVLEKRISAAAVSRIKKALTRNRPGAAPFCVELNIDGRPSVLTFIPIRNFYGKSVAYIFGISGADSLLGHDRSFFLIFTALMLLFIMLVVFTVYYRISQKKIEMMATRDSLTGVYTRGMLFTILESEYERFKRYKKPFCLVMVDVDHFKQINDTQGHATGDIVLAGVARTMKKNIRNTDSVGRYGGEEFIILLPETGGNEALVVVEKIRQKIASREFYSSGRVTVSCGIAEMDETAASVEDLISAADKKMYRAKQSGRDRVVL